jgi:hypothetical protein
LYKSVDLPLWWASRALKLDELSYSLEMIFFLRTSNRYDTLFYIGCYLFGMKHWSNIYNYKVQWNSGGFSCVPMNSTWSVWSNPRMIKIQHVLGEAIVNKILLASEQCKFFWTSSFYLQKYSNLNNIIFLWSTYIFKK